MTIGGTVAASSATTTRLEWMDLLRGVAIIFVVLFHAETVIRNDSVAPMWLSTFNEVFSPLRMPVMVFLSGLLVSASLRKGTKDYIAGKFRRIGWPYLVWSVLMVGLFVVASRITGDSWSLLDVTRALYDPVEHLWFLYYLLGYYLIALALRKAPAWVTAAVYLATAVAASLLGWTDLQIFAFLGVFFSAGVYFSSRREHLDRITSSWSGKLWASLGLSLMVAVALIFGQVRYEVLIIPIVALAGLGAVAAARSVPNAGWNVPLRFVGRHSLYFYLAHYPAIIIAAALAEKVTDRVPVVLFFEIVAGLAAGWLAVLLKRAFPATNLLFEFPRR